MKKIHIKKIKPIQSAGPGPNTGGSCAPAERD